MGIVAWIVLGLIAGAIAKALMPGPDPGGIVVTILIGLTAVENRAFQFEPTIAEAACQHTKAYMSGILQMVGQGSRRIFRRRRAMHESDRPKCRLTRIPDVNKPSATLTEG